MVNGEFHVREGSSMPDRTVEPVNETHEPGRTVGKVIAVQTRDKGFIFLQGLDGRECFAHRSTFRQPELFDAIEIGAMVSFKIGVTSKGLRAFEIEPATETEEEILLAAEENAGNR